MPLSDNLQRIRKLKRFSVPEIAAEIGISRQVYYQYEKGGSVPGKEKLEKIAKFFGVSVADLYSEDPAKKNEEQKAQAHMAAEKGLMEAVVYLTNKVRTLEEELRKCKERVGYKDL